MIPQVGKNRKAKHDYLREELLLYNFLQYLIFLKKEHTLFQILTLISPVQPFVSSLNQTVFTSSTRTTEEEIAPIYHEDNRLKS